MMLGITTVGLIFRTAVPAIGLSILIVIVTACSGVLATPRQSSSSPPEAPSPRRINISRDISSADSDEYPPSRYEDLKEQAIRSSTTFMRPREAPKTFGERGGLPRIARPITGFAGVGGLPVQGELFPPPRAETILIADRPRQISIHVAEIKPKKSFFDFSKAASAGGKMTIGNPILQNNAGQNPLNKIATIDLQEAARAEKERRAMATKRDSDLVARRPAPQPPNITPEEALKRSVSVKRKEVGSVFSPPASMAVANLQPISRSLSTSAQLSPGVEEIRRRSPRQPPQEMQADPISQRPLSPPKSEEPRRAPSPPQQSPEAEGSPVFQRPQTPPRAEEDLTRTASGRVAVRATIRPSRRLASPKESPPPEPSKTPLQRRPTNGLPPGPKARKLNITQEAGAQAQQTVMFVNNIVYDDPNEVQRIIDGAANDRASKIPPRPRTPERTKSVVNRPRPIPRKASEAAVEEAWKHRRSRSGGSMISRKSILMSNPGSPGQLPPLPPPPKSAGVSSRPHPNDTKSMTVDEKMGLFFPRPPSSGGNTARRNSQIPDLPPVPAAYFESTASPTSPDYRRSNRTTKTSVRTDNIFEVEEIIQKAPNNSRFSPDTVRHTNYADEVGQFWVPGMADSSYRQTQTTQASSSQGGGAGKRGSSPVLPIRGSSWTETTDAGTHNDSTTHWNSVYSAEVGVGVHVERQVAKATNIQRVESRSQKDKNLKPAPVTDEPLSGEEIGFMLGPSTNAGFEDALDARDAWLQGGERMMRPLRASQYQWHRRVGDNCPTFSDRKKVRSRKMSPPRPLLLHSPANNNMEAVFVRAEPSPLESPEQAVRKIQEQLQRFEQPNRDSSGSQEGQRIALLENLEKEMGMQENHWHEMQHDLGRDSMSSVQTMSVSSNRNSRADRDSVVVSRDAGKHNIAQERRASRRSRVRAPSVSKPVNELPQASTWQQRLAEAEMEFMDQDTMNRRSINFLAVSVSKAQLGSPTPPDSDQSDYDDEMPVMHMDAVVAVTPTQAPAAVIGQPQRMLLWVPAPATTTEHRSTTKSLLWTPPAKRPTETDVELPGLSVRPVQRKEWTSLKIVSTQLWRRPVSKNRSTTGLWRPSWANLQSQPSISSRPVSSVQSETQSSQKAPRPVTQRPPRRNKRVTLLPDIVENPEPLPDKRGTLGIFQFPWGERSDTASIQPVRSTMGMAMPGTMTSGGQSVSAAMEARARQLEAAEYSSSFFDDYDDEGSDDEEGEDSGDDGFDETTLWEIASLLKTDNESIPSKNSLFPPPLASFVVDDYMNDIPSDDESESLSSEQSIVIGLADEETFFEQPPESGLWQGPAMTPSRGDHGMGLPSPDKRTWETYSAVVEVPRVKRRKVEPMPSIQSDHLWKAEIIDVVPLAKTWTAGSKQSKIPRPAGEMTQTRKHGKLRTVASLWHPRAVSSASGESYGMFRVDARRTDYRTTSKQPAALDMARRLRPAVNRPLQRLVSSSLWTKTRNHKVRFQQMSHGMWSPAWVSEHTESNGLFTVNRNRSDYRNTSKQPAALDMARRPRPAGNKPLERLTSWTMWTKTRNHKTRFQEMSHGMWSPAWVAEHTESNGLFTVNRKRSDYRMTLKEPAAKSMARRPRAAELKPLEKLASTKLWTAHGLHHAEQNWITASAKSVTQRRQYRKEDWEAALAQAIKSSYPPLTRKTATPAEWEAALNEAISLSAKSNSAAVFVPEPESVLVEDNTPEVPDFIRAQIEALEQEKMFVAQAAKELYAQQQQQQKTQLWFQPDSNSETAKGAMWLPGASAPGTEAAPVEDAVARHVRSKSRKEKADIMAQIKAIEEAGKVDTFEGMWRGERADGVEEKDWLGEGRDRRVSRVVLRY